MPSDEWRCDMGYIVTINISTNNNINIGIHEYKGEGKTLKPAKTGKRFDL
jgi:hypothetical protein